MSTDKSPLQNPHKDLLKSSFTLSLGVLTSRFLGFIRDVILANLLGTGAIAEAFFVAQRIPNVLRDLAGEGAANAAIVPVLAEYQQTKTKQQWHQLVNVTLAWGSIILGILTVIGIVSAPVLVKIIAPGFIDDTAKYQLTVDLTRIMFPYLILVALTALQMGVLYTLNSFTTPAFSSCLLNLAMIASAWIAFLFSWAAAYILAAGVLLGGLLQLMFQRRALAKRGLKWTWPSHLRHEGVGKMARLLMPRLWGTAVYQLNIFVDTLCASLAAIVGSGGVAAIYFANRLIQLPLGAFAYAISGASLATLSSLAAQKDHTKFKETLLFSLKNLLFLLLPCAVLLCVLSSVLVQSIFEHGAFDKDSTVITAAVLTFLSLGLPFFGAARILVSGFYALQDTQTSVRIASVCLLINGVLNVILMFPMKISGIALASSVSGLANFLMLLMAMSERLGGMKGVLRKFFLKISLPVIGMFVWMFWLLKCLALSAILKLIIVGFSGLVIFVLSSLWLNVPEIKPLWMLLKSRLKPSP